MPRHQDDPSYKRQAHSDAVFSWRPTGAVLTAHSSKTVKGEALGYVSAIAYLAPHTTSTRKTVCPYSTPACRAGCLAGAGMGALPKQANARHNRTRLWREDPAGFLAKIAMEIFDLQMLAAQADMALAVRVNGTSDLDIEHIKAPNGKTLMETFPGVTFYDYTRWPLHKRSPSDSYHLTYSLADDRLENAIAYLKGGQSVTVVVEEEYKMEDGGWFLLGDHQVNVVDGDLHDLRFLDPPGSLVMLKPKGREIYNVPAMIRNGIVKDLMAAHRAMSS